MGNLLKIRLITEVFPKIIAKLLNITVHTYNAFEQGRMTPPPEVVKMIAMMYRIDESLLTAEPLCIDKHSLEKSQVITKLPGPEKFSYLSVEILGKNVVPNYRNIGTVKEKISKTLELMNDKE